MNVVGALNKGEKRGSRERRLWAGCVWRARSESGRGAQVADQRGSIGRRTR